MFVLRFSACFGLVSWYWGLFDVVIAWEMLKLHLVVNAWLLHAWTVEEPGVFAQASESPWNLRRAPVLSESPSRSSKEVSPKRTRAKSHYSHFSSFRLCERSSFEREDPLAWAGPFSLSENWARMCLGVVFSSVLGWLSHVWLDYYVKAWIEWFCMYWMVYGLKLMSLVWSWYGTWMDGWL